MVVNLSVEATESAPALRLRPWRAEDVEALVLAHRDPLMRRWLTTCLDSEEEARRWVDDQSEGWAVGTRLSFAVLEHSDGKKDVGHPIGHVVIKGAGPSEDSAEVGYWTSAEGRGEESRPALLRRCRDGRFALSPCCPWPALTWFMPPGMRLRAVWQRNAGTFSTLNFLLNPRPS